MHSNILIYRDYIVKYKENPLVYNHAVLDTDLISANVVIGEIVNNTLKFFDAYIGSYPDFNVPLSIEGPFLIRLVSVVEFIPARN